MLAPDPARSLRAKCTELCLVADCKLVLLLLVCQAREGQCTAHSYHDDMLGGLRLLQSVPAEAQESQIGT